MGCSTIETSRFDRDAIFIFISFIYFNKIILVVKKSVMLAENDYARCVVFINCATTVYADVGTVSLSKIKYNAKSMISSFCT